MQNENRVLGRLLAVEVSEQDLAEIAGGGVGHIPTYSHPTSGYCPPDDTCPTNEV